MHWFIVPVFACGVLCCFDGLLLFSNHGRNLFQPVPLLGAFGVYFFLVGPLLHTATDYWFTSDVWAPTEIPEDWRTWLGLMALINLLGLGMYKALYRPFTGLFLRRQSSRLPILDVRLVASNGVIFIAGVFLLQLYVYYRFGGIGGFVEAFSSATQGRGTDFAGLGWLLSLAESFPVLFAIVCSVLFRRHLQRIGSLRLLVYIGATFALTLLFGGLRGSRGNTIFTIAYIVGIIHFTVRPLTVRVLAVCGSVCLLFMYVYGFYKANPRLLFDPAAFVDAVSSSESRDDLERTSRRGLQAVLMGDLERSDVQAYLLFRMLQQGANVELAYGRTYVEGALDFIPYGLFHYRLPGKLKYGTDAVFGSGTFSPGRSSSAKIYGLAGETMLNFGPYGSPFGFILLAAAVGYARASNQRLSTSADSGWYLAPIISLACIVLLSSDLDNVIYLLLQHALMPFILIRICSGARRRPEAVR
jgi:hypothetical protein